MELPHCKIKKKRQMETKQPCTQQPDRKQAAIEEFVKHCKAIKGIS